MLSFSIVTSDIKNFMQKLLREDCFDGFSVRTAEIFTIAKFEINGRANKDFFDDTSNFSDKYCEWGQLRPYVFNIIKGSKKPTRLKLVLSCKDSLLEDFHENAQALFLNMSFENNEMRFFTGTAQKVFSMEKDMDIVWDEYIKDFFIKNGMVIAMEL